MQPGQMQTPAVIRAPRVHPVLSAVPAGLWIVSLSCDLLYLGGAEADLWAPLALYTMVGGFLVALAAALPQLTKFAFARVPVSLVVASLYAVNLSMRLGDAPRPEVAIALSVIGVGILAVSWLSGGKVRVQGVSE
jgi:uncharacterized membrane protein